MRSAFGCPSLRSLALSMAGGTNGNTIADDSKAEVKTDCVFDTGRAACEENCRTACAAKTPDMLSCGQREMTNVPTECFSTIVA